MEKWPDNKRKRIICLIFFLFIGVGSDNKIKFDFKLFERVAGFKIKDKEIIKFANQTGTILVFSNSRHFNHWIIINNV